MTGNRIPNCRDYVINWRYIQVYRDTMFDRSLFSPDLSELIAQAERAAGRPESLRTRAAAYLEIYRSSNRTCVFALVAAHGAIWASWYLVCAKLAAMVFAVLDPTGPYRPRYRYGRFAAYVLALKEINRNVMIATYVIVHGLRELGPERLVAEGIPEDLVGDYAHLMGKGGSHAELRDLYHRHFLWEQERVVSSTLDEAFAVFDWPFMSALCQRPWVWFSYFRVGRSMNFRCFTDQEERVEKGLIAFDRAAEAGWPRIETLTERLIRFFCRVLGQSRA